MAKALKLTPDGIKYHLNKLKKAKVIEHAGSTKAGKWIIKSKK